MPLRNITELISQLRFNAGDSTSVEVKSARGGLPESLLPSLSALANLPGGGTIILGLDETAGFEPVELSDIQGLKQGLAKKARAFVPPVQVFIDDAECEGMPLIVATVMECDPSSKPCRSTVTGKAYLRAYDGDFSLSELEIQAFLSQRQPPRHDRVAVTDATLDDLDLHLTSQWLATLRRRDPTGLGQFSDDQELLSKAGVMKDRHLTVAGLLALGVYPQQFFPRWVIQVAAEPSQGSEPSARARNAATLTGPLPHMLDQAMAWAEKTFQSSIISLPNGHAVDRYQYPLEAFREIIANSLVHRDLNQWSEGLAIEVRLRRDRLVVRNPGGLYGITVDRLGRDNVTSARNEVLVDICQNLHTASGRRVIEGLSTGIPTITASLKAAGLPPANYMDSGISFTVTLRESSPGAGQSLQALKAVQKTPTKETLNESEHTVYTILTEPMTTAHISRVTGIAPPTVRKALRKLRSIGLISQNGGRGLPTSYVRVTA